MQTNYEDLTRTELINRLRLLESDGGTTECSDSTERERLVAELQIHQFELEAQNLSLRESQAELEASHSRYADLYDFAPIAYCTFDCQGLVLAINVTGAKLLGRETGRIAGRPFRLAARMARSDVFMDHLLATVRSVGPMMTELCVETDAGAKELQLISTAVVSPKGVTTIRSAFLDVSAQRQAEREALAEKGLRERLDAIERAAADTNDGAGFLQVAVDEARAALIARYGAMEVRSDGSGACASWVFSGVAPQDVAAIGCKPEVFRDWPGTTSFLRVPIEYQLQTRGHLCFANKIGAGEFSADDQRFAEVLADRIGVGMEIARLRRAEAEEHRAAELLSGRLASAVENAEDALALYDARHRLALCNSAYRQLLHPVLEGSELGRSYAEIVDAQLSLLNFASEEERAQFRASRLAADATLERFDIRLRDGRSLRIRNRPTLEGGMVQTILDLSEDARHERELSDARTKAEDASAAKSEFLSSMSHELRTPLNAILGFTQLLRHDRKHPLAERHVERLRHVEQGGEHLLHLIDDVLDLSRIEAGRATVSIEPVSLAGVLRDVENTLASMAAQAGIQLSMPAAMPLDARVLADSTRYKQVLVNFGTNAIKYGRRGGKVEYRVSQRDGFLRVSVADDGMGIPADKQGVIFAPFQRAGRESGPIEGTGIGLAISKRLTALMEGRIGFESVEGQGSEFWIELRVDETPRVTCRAPEVSGRPGLAPAAAGHILYIEDNPLSTDLLRDLLRDFEGIELETVPTAELGIERVRKRLPKLVLMDINLPGMSGLEAARSLREWPETRSLPLIAVSAAVMPKDVERIQRAGFDEHLRKPLDISQLLQVLEHWLATPAQA